MEMGIPLAMSFAMQRSRNLFFNFKFVLKPEAVDGAFYKKKLFEFFH